MRKALIAAIVASALFAVGAFAANFAVETEDVASGSNPVTACADAVKIEFRPAAWAGDTYTVAGLDVTFRDATGEGGALQATNDCNGKDAAVVVERTSGDTEIDNLTVTSTGTLPVTFTAIPVSDIVGAAVLVENIYLDDLGDQIPTP
jgi:hypothetical protein